MFDWGIFAVLFAACVVVTLVSVPRQVHALQSVFHSAPPAQSLLLSGGLQNLILSGIGAALGAALAPQVGLTLSSEPGTISLAYLLTGLARAVVPALLAVLAVMAGLLALYYGIFRPRLPVQDVIRAERLRSEIGLLARALQGGVVEEVVFRWGAMTLLAWLGQSITGELSAGVMWMAVAGASLLFGLFHLPGAAQLGLARGPMAVGSVVIVNVWGGLIFGWMFWQYGLLAAMLAHAGVHVIWRSFDLRLLKQLIAQNPAA